MLKRLVVGVLLNLVALAHAAPLEIADIWRAANFGDARLSPDGQFFAATAPRNGRRNLVVVDLATRKAAGLSDLSDYDVVNVHWVGNDYLVFSLGKADYPSGERDTGIGGLYSVSRDGKIVHNLSQIDHRRGVWFLSAVKGSSDEVFVTSIARSVDSFDIYRVNLRTGRPNLVTHERPENVIRWVLDRNDVPRVAVSYVKEEKVRIVHYRESDTGPWQELLRFDAASGDTFVPLAFDDDNRSLIVATNQGRNTAAVFRYDPATRKLGEMLAQHPFVDIGADERGESLGSLITDRKTGDLLGFNVDGVKHETVWLDATYARLQKSIDAALPDTINLMQRSSVGHRVLVTAYSDRKPSRWYLLDEEKKTLEELFAGRPWLTPDKLVEMKPIFYKTRDGQEQLAYLFEPAGRKADQRVPLVVHVHGGPWVRSDYWGFGTTGTREAQLYAAQGYAVLLPQFRGTTEFGRTLYTSSRRQMGRAMQEDIEDATDWAVKQGIADPARVCLSGASYGGYAALMGVAKTPDKYRCAVAGLAVTDWTLLMTSAYGDTFRSESSLKTMADMIGDPEKDQEALRAVSPAYLADRIKASVLMWSGVNDIRVPLEHPKKMRDALEKLGKKVVWIQKDGEAHGYGKLENNVDLYTQVLKFLDENIGKGSH